MPSSQVRVPGEGRGLLPHRHLHGDREVVAGALGDALADEAEHAGPALERSAELVVAPVPERRQELVDQLGVARRELEAVVAGLARPRRGLAVLHGHGADVVAGHHVDRRAPVHGSERERRLRRRQQRLLALGGVGLVPRLHGEQPAEAHLDPDRGARPGGRRRPSAPGGASAPACSRSSCPARCGPRRRGRSCPG